MIETVEQRELHAETEHVVQNNLFVASRHAQPETQAKLTSLPVAQASALFGKPPRFTFWAGLTSRSACTVFP